MPAYKVRPDGLYITTANYALYRIDTSGKVEQLQPPPPDFAAPVKVLENSPEILCGGYETTDGRIVIFRDAITREEPFIFTPKTGFTNTNSSLCWPFRANGHVGRGQ